LQEVFHQSVVGENRWDEKAGLRTGCGVRSQVIDVLKAQIKRRPAMKKVSTVAAKPGKKISQQKLTVGLDLGDRNSWYCVLDESGQLQLEQRVRTNDGSTPQWLRALATEGVPSINVGSPGCASA